ncbi:MAG: SDR family NAD(P)-dependent oxidoreductase, partial [Nocardioides sp.]
MLARRGHGVTLVARREDRLRALAEELGDATRVEVIGCDLADAGARAGLLDEVAARGLEVDVLVNNAGLGALGPVAALDVDDELRMVRVNVEAVLDLTTRAVQQMAPRGRGAVLNVASTAAFQPFPGQASYAASKAFVLSYTEALRVELAGSGVSVTALCPGPVRTEFLAASGADEESFGKAVPSFLWQSSLAVATAGLDG